MGRIRWGRLFTALLILLLFIYGGARLLNVPVPFVDTLIARAIPGAEGRATAVAQPPAQPTAPANAPATAVPASAAPTRAAATTAPAQSTATPAQRAPATPLPVQD